MAANIDFFADPGRLWRPSQIMSRPQEIPCRKGIYGWYFDATLTAVPNDGCTSVEGFMFLYVGIAGRDPSSPRTLRERIIDCHLEGTATVSTLRCSLGCLLTKEVSIQLLPAGEKSFSFGRGECKLSRWMLEHARVAWQADAKPWGLEIPILRRYSLPLNLKHNTGHPFYRDLKRLRKRCRDRARPS